MIIDYFGGELDLAMNLLQINDGEWTRIKSIPEGEAGQRLEALGLRAGKKIKKISGMPFGGPITLMLDGRHFAVAHGIAAQIEVEAPTSAKSDINEKSSIWQRFI